MRLVPSLAVVLAVAGCSAGGDTPGGRISVVVPDNNIREEGVECAGARPFRQIRRGTEFAIEAGGGEVVARGELPAGTAVNADPDVDWGVERIPTVCVFELDVELPEHARYRLVLPETRPLEFDGALLGRADPVRLVLSG
jgi:hypothetical protein